MKQENPGATPGIPSLQGGEDAKQENMPQETIIEAVTRNMLAAVMGGFLLAMMWLSLALIAVIAVTGVVGAVFPPPTVYPRSPADAPGTPPLAPGTRP